MDIMKIYTIVMTVFIICLILMLVIAIIAMIIFMNLKFPNRKVFSYIRNKIKYLLRINITSIDNIFKVTDDVWEIEQILPSDKVLDKVFKSIGWAK